MRLFKRILDTLIEYKNVQKQGIENGNAQNDNF
jgi:hypothetical protein